jgi:hypothetical protein
MRKVFYINLYISIAARPIRLAHVVPSSCKPERLKFSLEDLANARDAFMVHGATVDVHHFFEQGNGIFLVCLCKGKHSGPLGLFLQGAGL